MIEFYPQILWLHISAMIASGGLFTVRGVLVQTGSRWGMATPVRYLSYTIDTVLLAAALMLVTILPRTMFANGWLMAKLALLPVYIVLASFALKRGRTAKTRRIFLAAAMAVFATMIGIARAHHPLGWLQFVSA
jgi:uncharacterized membrane protein SirB2